MKSTSFRACLPVVALLAAIATAEAQTVSLNEIRIDQSGADNDEYFELTGAPGASLDNLTLVADRGG